MYRIFLPYLLIIFLVLIFNGDTAAENQTRQTPKPAEYQGPVITVSIKSKKYTPKPQMLARGPVVAPNGFYSVTGYSTSQQEGTGYYTASGARVAYGICAADPVYPFGTKFEIPGYGICTVLDRGGAIKGNKIDVYFPNYDDAIAWGRRVLKIRRL